MERSNGKYLYNCRNCARFGEHTVPSGSVTITKVGCEIIDCGDKYPITYARDRAKLACREYIPKGGKK